MGRERSERGRSPRDEGRSMSRFSDANLEVAREILSRYPVPKSAVIPLCHLAQEQDGHLTDDAMAHIAEHAVSCKCFDQAG